MMKASLDEKHAITVSADELLSAMVPGYGYKRDEVIALLYDRPKMAVRETLDTLVETGKVWRTKVGQFNQYMRLSDEDLDRMARSKADRLSVPAWATTPLRGYDQQNRKFQQLCELTRR